MGYEAYRARLRFAVRREGNEDLRSMIVRCSPTSFIEDRRPNLGSFIFSSGHLACSPIHALSLCRPSTRTAYRPRLRGRIHSEKHHHRSLMSTPHSAVAGLSSWPQMACRGQGEGAYPICRPLIGRRTLIVDHQPMGWRREGSLC